MGKTENILKPDDSWRRSVNFTFGGEGGLDIPEEFTKLRVGDHVIVVAKGKVRSLQQIEDGGALCLVISDLQIETGKKKTLGQTIEELQGKRKKN